MYSTNEKPGSGKFFIESAAWDFQSSNFWVEFLCSGIFFEGRVQQRPSPFFTRSAPRHERVRGAKGDKRQAATFLDFGEYSRPFL